MSNFIIPFLVYFFGVLLSWFYILFWNMETFLDEYKPIDFVHCFKSYWFFFIKRKYQQKIVKVPENKENAPYDWWY